MKRNDYFFSAIMISMKVIKSIIVHVCKHKFKYNRWAVSWNVRCGVSRALFRSKRILHCFFP